MVNVNKFVAGVGRAVLAAGLGPAVCYTDRNSVINSMDSNGVGTNSISQFERLLCHNVKVNYAVAVSSGTAALHLALMAAGVKPGHSVVVPSMGFVAAANAVSYIGARPVFGDADGSHGGLVIHEGDESSESWDKAKAVIGINLWGFPGGMRRLEDQCVAHGKILIEDASQALGSFDGDQNCGSFGRMAVMSFNINKIVTTGGGGAVLTNDRALADRVRYLSTQARDTAAPHAFFHTEMGWNYRMSPLCAALGCSQIGRLPELIECRKNLWDSYVYELNEMTGVLLPGLDRDTGWNYWMPHCFVDRGSGLAAKTRDRVLSALAAAGLHGREAFTPLHTLPHYSRNPAILPSLARNNTAASLYARTVCLPVRLDHVVSN